MNRSTDVVIVGAGAIGCCIAYRLAQKGIRVSVVERERPGSGASASAGGILGAQYEATGPGPLLDLLLASREAYPDFAAELQADSGIDIEFRLSGGLRLILDEEDEAEARRCLQWQKAAGLPAELLSASSTLAEESALSPEIRGAILFPQEAQVGNRKMVEALATACGRLGVEVLCGEEAVRFHPREHRLESLETSSQSLSAQTFILAGGAWSQELASRMGVHLPVFPVRGQMIQLQINPPPFRRLLFHRQAYLVSKPVGRIILGSTMEKVGFDRRVTAEGLHRLTGAAARMSPLLGGAEVVQTWACFRPGTPDGLPILGRVQPYENLLAATGHFRNGILLTPITGQILAEMVAGVAPSIPIEPFRPDRF
ncbi:MAG: glycine oxidase ThiO [Planctomycetes bacterium]|nr:glycine oxidase ThiO [Planctomycetota bacterium]